MKSAAVGGRLFSTAPRGLVMFTDEDLKRLDLFRDALIDLRVRAIVQDWPQKLSVDIFGIDSTDLEGVREDDLRAFLTALRQFTNEGEATNFFSICNVLSRGSSSTNLRGWVAHARAAWQDGLKSSAGISLNGKMFALKEILELLLYGEVVHRDSDKLAQLKAMPRQDRALLRMMLIGMVPPLLQALNIIDHMIRYIRDDRVHEVPELVE